VAIRVGHSADPDDAFMVWALEAGAVDTRGLELEPVVSDIQTLNDWALEGRLEVTAVSAGAYPSIADRYALLPHGASFGEGYGPIVVAREPLSLDELREFEIVTPGPLTTATRVLRLALGANIRTRDLPFDEVLDEVTSGRARAGLVIHEGQLTYAEHGLEKVLDLGVWWQQEPRGATSTASTTSRRCCARRSTRASPIATQRCSTRWDSAVASTRRPRTSSWRCT
jgi:1,4-dihydroxy-6-naphthoate synthase